MNQIEMKITIVTKPSCCKLSYDSDQIKML